MTFTELITDTVRSAVRVARRDGIRGVAMRCLIHGSDFVGVRRFLRAANSLPDSPSPEQLVDLVLSNKAVRPLQIKSEIVRLAALVKDLRPQTLLEIGTAEGGTFFVFCRCASPTARIISVDLAEGGGPFGGGYRVWRERFYRKFGTSNQTIQLIRADSHNPATLERVERELHGVQLDFLFIDGDHTYEGVKRDFDMYLPLVRKGGLIAMHDIAPPPVGVNYGVHELWSEIRTRFQSQEIVEDPDQGAKGIGLVWV